MALCRFTRDGNTIALDAPAEREWGLVAAGRAGTATVTLPRGSAAASSTYINPEGGSILRISGQAGAGDWVGMVTGLEFSADAIVVSALQPWAILGRRIVRRPLTLTSATPAVIATTVVREALTGLPWFSATLPFTGGGPITLDYDLDGQDAWSVFSDLSRQGGGELHIDAVTGRMDWCGPLAYATQHSGLLVAGVGLQDWRYGVDSAERVTQMTAILDNLRVTVASGTGSGWAQQATTTAGTSFALVDVARAELAALSAPSIAIAGGVTSDWWSIRTRDFVRVLLPGAGFGGETHVCRVVGRRLADGSPLMGVELQVVDTSATLLQGIPGRQAPPQRRSFAARWRDVLREVNKDRMTTR